MYKIYVNFARKFNINSLLFLAASGIKYSWTLYVKCIREHDKKIMLRWDKINSISYKGVKKISHVFFNSQFE